MHKLLMLREHQFMRSEFDWLAHDDRNHVGVLSSAGRGPVPDAVVAAAVKSPRLEEVFNQLPVICDAVWAPGTHQNSQEWFEMARRGLYSFDWNFGVERYKRS